MSLCFACILFNLYILILIYIFLMIANSTCQYNKYLFLVEAQGKPPSEQLIQLQKPSTEHRRNKTVTLSVSHSNR